MIAARLLGIEWLKMRRRPGFWLGLLFFFGLMTLGFVLSYRQHAAEPAIRNVERVWMNGVSGIESIGMLVMLVTIILLTASEKTWRTERQNVIDGLSRSQYFTAKLLLVIGIALLMWFGTAAISATFAVLERRLVDSSAVPFVDSLSLRLLAGALLFLVGIGALALFFGTVSSSSGAALALAVLLLIAEQPISFLLAREGGLLQQITAYLPHNVLSGLVSRTTWDADAYARATTAAMENRMPLTLSGAKAAAVAAVYTALFGAGAWLSVRTRDL
jgi:ABC-type transport system involved in multi-copper enzyme maturation permease subunit